MKTICLLLGLLSASAWANGYRTGTFNCGIDGKPTVVWKISNVDSLPNLPYVEYSLQTGQHSDTVLRGIATVQEVIGGTSIGVHGLRYSDDMFKIFFSNDGSISAGEIPCTNADSKKQ
jgi:hypothetical protein